MTVDAYAHCGRDRYLPVEALDAVMAASEVTAAVLCQHLGQFDNSYIALLVNRRPERFAGIALIDHRQPDPVGALTTVVEQGFRGVRITEELLCEAPAIADAVARAGLTVVVYAPAGVEVLVPALATLAAAHPDTKVVVSHLGNPRVQDGRLESGAALLALAVHRNVFVGLSGLAMFCPFPYAPLDGFVGEVIDAFGAERTMWGSNFPVCGEYPADYVRELALVRDPGKWGLTRDAVVAVTDTTARHVWFG